MKHNKLPWYKWDENLSTGIWFLDQGSRIFLYAQIILLTISLYKFPLWQFLISIFQHIYSYILKKAFLFIPVTPQQMWPLGLVRSRSFLFLLQIRKLLFFSITLSYQDSVSCLKDQQKECRSTLEIRKHYNLYNGSFLFQKNWGQFLLSQEVCTNSLGVFISPRFAFP